MFDQGPWLHPTAAPGVQCSMCSEVAYARGHPCLSDSNNRTSGKSPTLSTASMMFCKGVLNSDGEWAYVQLSPLVQFPFNKLHAWPSEG